MVKKGQGNVPKLKFNLFSSFASDWTLLWWGTSLLMWKPSGTGIFVNCLLSFPYTYPVCKINMQLFNTYSFWLLTFFSPISLIFMDSGIMHSTRQQMPHCGVPPCSQVTDIWARNNFNKEVYWSLKALAEKWWNNVSHKTLSTDLKWTNNISPKRNPTTKQANKPPKNQTSHKRNPTPFYKWWKQCRN